MMTHGTEHITDPSVFRLRVSAAPSAVVFAWDYPGSTLLRVRILRSQTVFADDPDDERTVVYDGVGGSFRDAEASAGRESFYTVWARHADADAEAGDGWVLWARRRVRVGGGGRSRRALARLLGRG